MTAAYSRLRVANLVLAALHAAQAVAVVAIGASLDLPVYGTWAQGPPGSDLAAREQLFSVPVAWAVALFLLLAALDHLLVASPGIVRWYERGLDREINQARWLEYSVSASVMMVLIAMFTGIADIAAIIAIFGANVAMILFGWVMERQNRDRRDVDWAPFWFGCIAGAVPWVAVTAQLIGSESGDGSIPRFVYGIFVSLFVLFNTFAVNMWLQYRRVGPWRRYVVGEWGYLVLSLVAKSALAWQIYAGALAG